MEDLGESRMKDIVNQLLPDLARYYVAEYQHIDDFRCMRPLREYFNVFPYEDRRSEQLNNELYNEIERRLSTLETKF